MEICKINGAGQTGCFLKVTPLRADIGGITIITIDNVVAHSPFNNSPSAGMLRQFLVTKDGKTGDTEIHVYPPLNPNGKPGNYNGWVNKSPDDGSIIRVVMVNGNMQN